MDASGIADRPQNKTININYKNEKLIDDFLKLKYPPVAINLVESGDPAGCAIGEDVYRPSERGDHIALCQAFALARREGRTVYMRKEDHWCWNPLITLGHVKCEEKTDPGFDVICGAIGIDDRDIAEQFVSSFMKLPYQKYEGVLIAPLGRAGFAPDLTMIYCDNGQLRAILRAARQSGELVKGEFDAFDSCLYAVIPPLLTGEYRITVPDPGEYERALTDGDAIIFSIPAAKMDAFMGAVSGLLARGFNSRSYTPKIKEDFDRPPFYNELFTAWGLK